MAGNIRGGDRRPTAESLCTKCTWNWDKNSRTRNVENWTSQTDPIRKK